MFNLGLFWMLLLLVFTLDLFDSCEDILSSLVWHHERTSYFLFLLVSCCLLGAKTEVVLTTCPRFFCDVNWPLKDLFFFFSNSEILRGSGRRIEYAWMFGCVCVHAESKCCVCLYLNKPSVLLGRRNFFLLVDSICTFLCIFFFISSFIQVRQSS